MTLGIDEAGRGCWAGPLVAAAVVLPRAVPGLKDSKQLTKTKREELYELIMAEAVVGIGWVQAAEIDELGLTAATKRVMHEAASLIRADYHEVVIDGNYNYLPELVGVRVLPKADSLIPAVSAASIVAKVSRDRFMKDIAEQYPQYQFERHVGYGTALHYELLHRYGACELHRLSYKPLQALLRAGDV